MMDTFREKKDLQNKEIMNFLMGKSITQIEPDFLAIYTDQYVPKDGINTHGIRLVFDDGSEILITEEGYGDGDLRIRYKQSPGNKNT